MTMKLNENLHTVGQYPYLSMTKISELYMRLSASLSASKLSIARCAVTGGLQGQLYLPAVLLSFCKPPLIFSCDSNALFRSKFGIVRGSVAENHGFQLHLPREPALAFSGATPPPRGVYRCTWLAHINKYNITTPLGVKQAVTTA